MVRPPAAALVRCLISFVETHPGTRFGTLFGRPAAFAGRRVFAQVTNAGLSCCLPGELARRPRKAGGRLRQGRRRGWVVVTGARGDDDLAAHALLEVAAAHVATNHPILPNH